MSSSSHDAGATCAGSSEAQRQDAADDEPRQLELPNARMPTPFDQSTFNIFLNQGLVRCEICLRAKPPLQTGQLARYRTCGRSTRDSVAWHAAHPLRPRGDTIWKCVECSLGIDNDHLNWQERITSFGEARGRIYTSESNATADFYRPREADTELD